MPDTSPLRCAVVPDTRTIRAGDLPRIQTAQRWSLVLPLSVPVLVNDRITTLSKIYLIDEVLSPHTYQVDNTAFGYVILDTAHGAEALITNAIVSIKRSASVNGPQNIPAYVLPASHESYTTRGGAILSQIFFAPDTDIRQGDRVVVVSLDGFTVLPGVKPYELENIARWGGPTAHISADVNGFIT